MDIELLVFSQARQALFIPLYMISLVCVNSSISIMGVHKISGYLVLIDAAGYFPIFLLNTAFLTHAWVSRSQFGGVLSMENGNVVLIAASAAFISVAWVIFNLPKSVTLSAAEKAWMNSDSTLSGISYIIPDIYLPNERRDSENLTCQRSLRCQLEVAPTVELVPDSIAEEVHDIAFPEKNTSLKSVITIRRTVDTEVDSQIDKNEDHRDVQEPEGSYREASRLNSISEDPGSFRKLRGKSNEGGNGPGKHSRKNRLGCGARRQLVEVIYEFWSQLYDLHGKATKEAKQLDILAEDRDFKPAMVHGYQLASYLSRVPTDRSSDPLNTLLDFKSPSFVPPSYRDPLTSALGQNSQGPGSIINTSSMHNPVMSRTSRLQTNKPYYVSFSDGPVRSVRSPLDFKSPYFVPPSYIDPLSSVLGQNSQGPGSTINTSSMHNPMMTGTSRLKMDKPYYERFSYGPVGSVRSPLDFKSPYFVPPSYRDPLTSGLRQNSQGPGITINTSSVHNPVMYGTSRLQTDKPCYVRFSYGPVGNVRSPSPNKQNTGLANLQFADRISRWNGPPGFECTVDKMVYERSAHLNAGFRRETPSSYNELSSLNKYNNVLQTNPRRNQDAISLWSRHSSEQLYGIYDGSGKMGTRPTLVLPRSNSLVDSETKLLKSFRHCIMKLLKLEGSEWLFTQNSGADEFLMDQVAATEKIHYEATTRYINHVGDLGDSASKIQDADLVKYLVSSVSYCGEDCIWRVDLIVSFGVWCIHRILELALMESHPELWGKYAYALNCLQGILGPAFSKPRAPLPLCFCLQIPVKNVWKSNLPLPNATIPPPKLSKRKCITASTILQIMRDVEIAVHEQSSIWC